MSKDTIDFPKGFHFELKALHNFRPMHLPSVNTAKVRSFFEKLLIYDLMPAIPYYSLAFNQSFAVSQPFQSAIFLLESNLAN